MVRAFLDIVRSERWHPVALLSVASAAACAVALILAKLMCISAVAATELGREQLAAEASLVSVLSWFGEDLLVALVWGLGVGLAFGFARRPKARLAATIALAGVHAILAFLLLAAIETYSLFGVQPTWQLVTSLGGAATNAADSIAALWRPGRVVLLLGLILILAAGTPLLRRFLEGRGRLRIALTASLVALLLLNVGAFAVADRSHFELDRDPLASFVGSALFGQDLEPAVAAGEFAEVLAPVSQSSEAAADLSGYYQLRNWARRRPNVVLVILESTAVHQLSLMGGPEPNTPTLERLASEGMFWTRHYANTPNSMFAIYEIVCSNHGRPQEEHISRTRPRIDCRSLSEVLAERGYRAGLFHSGRFSYSEKDQFFVGRGYSVMYDAVSVPNRERFHESSWGIEERAQIDAMLDWVERAREEPLFVTYIPVYPHHPYDVPRAEYKVLPREGLKGKYRNSMLYVDTMIREMIEGFEDLGVADDTLFVFLGDHGEGFHEHPGSRMHGSKLYEEQVHTFAIFWAPGALDGPHRDHRPMSHVDIVPTLFDILGIEQQSAHVGQSAFKAGPRPMVPLYTGYGNPLVGFVDGDYKFIHNRDTGQSQLFDLGEDPRERFSLELELKDTLAVYRDRALAFVAAQKSWEDRLPDLDEHALEVTGPEQTWTVNPATCEFEPDYFEVKNDELRMFRAGERNVRCELALPDPRGQVTGFTIRGAEHVAGSKIVGTVLWDTPEGRTNQLAHCKFNGSPKRLITDCQAEVLPELARLGGGGTLAVELRYRLKSDVFDFSRFGVTEVEVKYRLAE